MVRRSTSVWRKSRGVDDQRGGVVAVEVAVVELAQREQRLDFLQAQDRREGATGGPEDRLGGEGALFGAEDLERPLLVERQEAAPVVGDRLGLISVPARRRGAGERLAEPVADEPVVDVARRQAQRHGAIIARRAEPGGERL